MSVLTRPEAVAIAAQRIFERSEEASSGCRLWTGPLNHAGYAVTRIPGHGHGSTGAYRVIYEWTYGPIPDGLQVDHRCHSDNLATCTDGRTCPHRRCVEPSHLELVTRAENNRRGMKAQKTHCRNGHPRTPENTYTRGDGRRQCRACHRDQSREYARTQAAAARAS